MEKITLFVVCVLVAVFEEPKADAQVNMPSLENSPKDPSCLNNVASSANQPHLEGESSVRNIASSADRPSLENTSGELSISDRAELQIINLCTEVPTFYDELVSAYTNEGSLSTESLQRIQNIEAKLKSTTDELRQYVSTYDQSISTNDPDAETIQKVMSSAVDELIQSVNKINGDLNSGLGQNAKSAVGEAEDRAQIIQNYVRPAMVKFEESCLLQTKDILKNVLSDYEASLLS